MIYEKRAIMHGDLSFMRREETDKYLTRTFFFAGNTL